VKAANRAWTRAFEDPILLPSDRKLVTLLDAATYATKLPKKEADTAAWQAAIEGLMLVATCGAAGPRKGQRCRARRRRPWPAAFGWNGGRIQRPASDGIGSFA
jgi:hypothetical protein